MFSKVNQLYIYPLFLKKRFFSHVDHYKVLCYTAGYLLVDYFIYSCMHMSVVLGWTSPHPGRKDASCPAALAFSNSGHCSSQDWNTFQFWTLGSGYHRRHCSENPATGSSEINFIDFVHRWVFELIFIPGKLPIHWETWSPKCSLNISKSVCEPCKVMRLCFFVF